MERLFFRHRTRWVVAALILVLLGAYAAFWFRNSVRGRARLPKLVERVHLLTKMMEVYVADNGTFPEDLPALVTEMHLDQRLLSSIAGEKVEYFRPTISAPGTTTVMVVTLGTRKIEVNKNFERHEKP